MSKDIMNGINIEGIVVLNFIFYSSCKSDKKKLCQPLHFSDLPYM